MERSPTTYWLTRFLILRLLGAVYAVAFLVAANQLLPLIGSDGLLPVGAYLTHVEQALGSTGAAFSRLPSFFWYVHSDVALMSVSWVGFAFACLVALGYGNALILTVLWALYLSIVHVGQDWYGYGWEYQLLETGFLAIFLCPLYDSRPFPKRETPVPVIWLFRWLIFRIMLGAGLIKIRGDECWRDLTALFYYFETQPIPNGLSRGFHFLPRGILEAGVVMNHLAELVAPWFVFGPRTARHIAGVVIIVFQAVLIASGNLSFLNWLTVVPALACFDDSFWERLLPKRLIEALAIHRTTAVYSGAMNLAAGSVAVVVGLLSIQPVLNLISPHQVMNRSYDPLELVNTYGAFGTIGRQRTNVIFEGTDARLLNEKAVWKPYVYRGLPVDLATRPPQVAPYQLRLDWQMWFAAMGDARQYPWTLNLIWKLLHNDPSAISLFGSNPFPDKPPTYIRAMLYRYSFAPPGNEKGLWWTRETLGLWLPPLSTDSDALKRFLSEYGWLPAPEAPPRESGPPEGRSPPADRPAR